MLKTVGSYVAQADYLKYGGTEVPYLYNALSVLFVHYFQCSNNVYNS